MTQLVGAAGYSPLPYKVVKKEWSYNFLPRYAFALIIETEIFTASPVISLLLYYSSHCTLTSAHFAMMQTEGYFAVQQLFYKDTFILKVSMWLCN